MTACRPGINLGVELSSDGEPGNSPREESQVRVVQKQNLHTRANLSLGVMTGLSFSASQSAGRPVGPLLCRCVSLARSLARPPASVGSVSRSRFPTPMAVAAASIFPFRPPWLSTFPLTPKLQEQQFQRAFASNIFRLHLFPLPLLTRVEFSEAANEHRIHNLCFQGFSPEFRIFLTQHLQK